MRHALDGDSLVLASGQQVRLLGVNAPEMSPEQPVARKARRFVAGLTEGKLVTLVFEPERSDHYGRLLAHVLLPDGRDLEELLLRQGLAWMVAIPPDVGWVPRLAAAEAEGRNARRGIWAEPAYAPIAAERLTASDTGFHFVSGKIRRVRESAHVLYFELAPAVTLLIPREAWRRYFSQLGNPKGLAGRRVIARGWIAAHDSALHLRVEHPAMLTWPH